ncbi:MAG: HD domain-containing protein [Prolixibacteraceae bacterium]
MTEELLAKGKQFFEDYTKKLIKSKDFYTSDNLQLKKDHSLRVAGLCAHLAGKLELDEEECRLAEFIGLMHDLGRFPQFEKYQSFDDLKTEDHASLSVGVLKAEDLFLELSEAEQQIVIQTIEGHNKLAISSKDKPVILFSQILRDADKLDLWEVAVSYLKRDGSFGLPSISLNLPKSPGVSEVVIKGILAGKPVAKKDLQSINDFKLFLMAMVYDLNFKASFLLLNHKQLITKIYDTLPKRDDVINVYRQIRLFIENKFVEQKGNRE